MLHVQKYLREHGLDKLIDEFDLKAKIYDNRVVFNYKITGKDKFHPIVKECRGLILSLDPKSKYEVLARPFDRFYNYGEGDDKDNFHWDNCTVLQKLDGSLINIYTDHKGDWCVATRGTAFAEATTPMGKTYYNLFLEAINNVNVVYFFNHLDKLYTYMFEITSPENRIVTRYNTTRISLIGMRNNITGDFVDYSIIKADFRHMFPRECKVRLPEIYDLSNPDGIIDFVESMDQLEEGVVCYDNETQARIKIKNSKYVAIHHLRGNETTIKSILTLILKNELEEYFTYFSEDREMFQPYIDKYNKLVKEIKTVYNKYKDIEDQKEFALNVKDLPYSGFLFRLRKGHTEEELFCLDNFNMILKQIEKEI